LLTCHSDPLQDVFRVYPKAEKTFRDVIRATNLGKGIKAQEFRFKKERLLILYHLLTNINDLDKDQIQKLADAVLIHRDMRTTMELLKVAVKGDKSGASGGLLTAAKGFVSSFRQSPKVSKEEELWKGANNFASLVSDNDFLGRLKTDTLDECLRDAAVEAEETAYVCLTTLVESLVAGYGQQILSMQKAECNKHIQREISSGEDRELGSLRAQFVGQIEDVSRQHSRSYVLYSLEGTIA
jgi:hypothetical protein